MSRDPALTFQSALRILGKYENSSIETLNTVLGGAIFAAGLGGLLSGAAPSLAALAPLWAWVDQKCEAIHLLKKISDRVLSHIHDSAGRERRELIQAAHGLIVAASFYEVLEECLQGRSGSAPAITVSEKEMRLIVDSHADPVPDLHLIFRSEIPIPSAGRGFHENLAEVDRWMTSLAARTEQFLTGLADWTPGRLPLARTLSERASERYVSRYLEMAAKVPEFQVWALMAEHAATRSSVREVRSLVSDALVGEYSALRRIEVLLATIPAAPSSVQDLSLRLSRSNRTALLHSVVRNDSYRSHDDRVSYPTIERSFVAPHYRIAKMSAEARLSDDRWWDKKVRREDIDVMFAAHAMSGEAMRLPLFLLGHPGAGKSMLTKVLAARMPVSSYTVVRVSLRDVGANAAIVDQIQAALDIATNRRIDWLDLSEESVDTVRVILLDGLDELLQATRTDRNSYLLDVARFQQVEAEQGRPVIVVVTARTVVADRLEIPAGCTVVRLEGFDSSQIEAWLKVWAETNRQAIDRGEIRALEFEQALEHHELARQPLLLLMLAVYSADWAAAPLARETSTTAMYLELLNSFARREVLKDPQVNSRSRTYDALVQRQLERLQVAALAMFNRGVQFVSDAELGADLAALTDAADPMDSSELGQRLLGEFFFVHAAEARLVGDVDGVLSGVHTAGARRTYEFLHATFGEFLVAWRVLEALRDAAEMAFGGRRRREPDDALIFALLSHQPLAVRQSAVSFLVDLYSRLPAGERADVIDLLSTLAMSYRRRHESERYNSYRPMPKDLVRELSAFSANLYLLWLAFQGAAGGPGKVSSVLASIAADDHGHAPWEATVALWRSGLDAEGFNAMVATFAAELGQGREIAAGELASISPEYAQALLVQNDEATERFRLGIALRDGIIFDEGPTSWALGMMSWLVPAISGFRIVRDFPALPEGGSVAGAPVVAEKIGLLLRIRTLKYDITRDLVTVYLAAAGASQIDPMVIALSIADHPRLLIDIPDISSYLTPVDGLLDGVVGQVLASASIQSAGDSRADNAGSGQLASLLTELRASFPQVQHSAGSQDIGAALSRLRTCRESTFDELFTQR